MTRDSDSNTPEETGTVQEQLTRAARDLWSMVSRTGEDFVAFRDRRGLETLVRRRQDGRYEVSWEEEDDSWTVHQQTYDSPREAAFHGYQGPH